MSNKTRLSGNTASFDQMMNKFGVVTVMNAKVYEYVPSNEGLSPTAFVNGLGVELCEIKTLKIANVTQEGPTKTVTGGQYSNPLIKFGKSARLEMQDALGSAKAIDALCGGVREYDGSDSSTKALHFGEDFNSPKTIVGDSFFIDQATGQQVQVKIVFYQFLPDSIFNLTQDAEGDATVFDMNGDLLTTNIQIPDNAGENIQHGLFYSIIPASSVSSVVFTLDLSSTTPAVKADNVAITDGTTYEILWKKGTSEWTTTAPSIASGDTISARVIKISSGLVVALLTGTKA